MQDEQFMRAWNDRHDRFSVDFDRGLGHLARHFAGSARKPRVIGKPYRLLGEPEPRPTLSPAARASLRGFAASVITIGLWMTVLVLATPAPGFASPIASPQAANSVTSGAPVLM